MTASYCDVERPRGEGFEFEIVLRDGAGAVPMADGGWSMWCDGAQVGRSFRFRDEGNMHGGRWSGIAKNNFTLFSLELIVAFAMLQNNGRPQEKFWSNFEEAPKEHPE